MASSDDTIRLTKLEERAAGVVRVSFYMSKHERDELYREAARRGITTSEAIRGVLRQVLYPMPALVPKWAGGVEYSCACGFRPESDRMMVDHMSDAFRADPDGLHRVVSDVVVKRGRPRIR